MQYQGANDNVTDNNDFTPLSVAAWIGHYDFVNLLCQNNDDVTIKNYWGHTVLDQAKEWS